MRNWLARMDQPPGWIWRLKIWLFPKRYCHFVQLVGENFIRCLTHPDGKNCTVYFPGPQELSAQESREAAAKPHEHWPKTPK
jgi:hypothetical protein